MQRCCARGLTDAVRRPCGNRIASVQQAGEIMNFYRVTGCLLVAMFLVGCASRPVNERITQVDPQAGYRPHLLIPKRQNNGKCRRSRTARSAQYPPR